MTEEWRQINAFPGVDIRRLYVDGEPTDLFMLNGRLGYLTAEWREKTKTLTSETKQLYVEGVPTLVHCYDGRAMPGISGGATVDKQVGQSDHDGGWTDKGGFDNSSTYHGLGKQFGTINHGFAWFSGVTLEGTIGTAYSEWMCHTAGSGSPLMKLYGVDEDDPAPPTSAAEADADPVTSASLDWDETWSTAGTWYQSGSMTSIFQELVDTYTISNERVGIFLKDDGSGNGDINVFRTYDFTGNVSGPKIHVEYSVVAGQPTEIRTWGVPTGHGWMIGAGKWN